MKKMADEYIRKAEAIEAVDFGITLASAINLETGEWSELFKRENDELRKAIERIQKIEPADVVQVVRCKDCKHCYYADNRVPDEQGWVCEINSCEPVNLNGFCSYGERKE